MDHWIQQIDQNTKRFIETFNTLTEGELNWRPNEETWSIAQNIRHVIIMNESYFKKINESKDGTSKTPFLAKFDFILRFMGNSIGNFGKPDRKKRTETFEIWKPEDQTFSTSILDDFKNHQDTFKKIIKQSVPLIGKDAVLRSPATNLLFFKPAQALDFIISHEERHFNQANEVFEKMKKEYD